MLKEEIELEDLKEWFRETYIVKLDQESRNKVKTLFKLWITELMGDKNQYSNIFEVLHKHKNQEIKNVCLKAIKTFLPAKFIEEFVKHWIYDPIKELEDTVNHLVGKNENLISKGTYAAYLLSTGRFEELEKFDPNLRQLNLFLQKIDKNFARPLYLKFDNYIKRDSLSNLDNFRFFRTEKASFNRPEWLREVEKNLISKKWKKLWTSLKSAPLSVSVRIMKFLVSYEWSPTNYKDKEIFDILKESWGKKGWQGIKEIVNLCVYPLKNFTQYPVELDISDSSLKRECVINPQIFIDPTYFDFEFDPFFSPEGNCLMEIPNYGFYLFDDSIQYFQNLNLLCISFQNKNREKVIEFLVKGEKIDNLSSNHRDFELKLESDQKMCILIIKDLTLKFNIPLINTLVRSFIFNINSKNDYLFFQKLSQNLLIKKNPKLHRILKGVIEIFRINTGYPKNLIDIDPIKIPNFESKKINSIQNEKSFEIGLDFGHSNTTLVVRKNKEKFINLNFPFSLEYENGEFIPSIITFKNNKEFKIGIEAQKISKTNNNTTFYKMKRYINENFRQVRFVDGKEVKVTEAASLFILKIFEDLFKKIEREEIESIILTIPINSSPEYESWIKKTIKRIIKQLNISKNIVNITKEGIASCYEITSELQFDSPVLLFDMGAQTTDIAIIEYDEKKNSIIIHSSIGDDLGGDDVDRILFDFFLSKFHFSDNSIIDKESLLNKCESIKKRLSKNKHVDTNFEKNIINNIKNQEEVKKCSYKEIEALLYDNYFYEELDELLGAVFRKISLISLDPDNLRNIVLIGGASQWPGIKEFLLEKFSQSKVISQRLQFINAIGAIKSLEASNIKNKTNHNYGVIIESGKKQKFCELIPKNSKIPTGTKSWKLELHDDLDHLILDLWRRRELINIFKKRKEIFYDDQGRLHIKTQDKKKIIYESLIEVPIIIDLKNRDRNEIFLNCSVTDDFKLRVSIYERNKKDQHLLYRIDELITVS